ncbi:hypothetical protein [Aquipuribacter sp. SD81]|uniref:hypothetical protein n=1 Tax=Aquipuribacter sp. SD81 TaxID=3127703 RepID=UPI00301B32AA
MPVTGTRRTPATRPSVRPVPTGTPVTADAPLPTVTERVRRGGPAPAGGGTAPTRRALAGPRDGVALGAVVAGLLVLLADAVPGPLAGTLPLLLP